MDLHWLRPTDHHSSALVTMMGVVGNGHEKALASLAVAWRMLLLLTRMAAHGFARDGIAAMLLPSFLPLLALIFIAWLLLE